MKKDNNVLSFQSFSKYNSLVHGFSTRFFGSLRPSDPSYQNSLAKFTKALNIDQKKIVRMHQEHTNIVYTATERDCGKIIQKTDGLISSSPEVFLGVITGDCIPILFYDPKMKIVAVVHAGWRGLFAEIIKEAVSAFVKKGSNPADIIVGIGPSIRVCCYSVSEEFVGNFRGKFEDVEKFVIHNDEKIFFDLQLLAKEQLQSLGILAENIEDADYCTFDHKDVYSYRREGENFGEMMGMIGLK